MQARCQALGLSRSRFYYQTRGESAANLLLMRLLDEEFTQHNFKGVLGLRDHLRLAGHVVNEKRVRRLVRLMGHEPIYPKTAARRPRFARGRLMGHEPIYPKLRLSVPGQGVTPDSYLLRDRPATAPNEVWSTDITYVPMAKGFLYLAAVLDWHSRYVLSWQFSNSLDVGSCLQTLADALRVTPAPYIFNSGHGSQYTGLAYEKALLDAGCRISRDGQGRATDNAFVERLWRTVKWEHINLNPAEDGYQLHQQLHAYFDYYNQQRPHQSLRSQTPTQVLT